MSRSGADRQYVGDTPKVQIVRDDELHWTEKLAMLRGRQAFPKREWGDNNPADPEQAGWDQFTTKEGM